MGRSAPVLGLAVAALLVAAPLALWLAARAAPGGARAGSGSAARVGDAAAPTAPEAAAAVAGTGVLPGRAPARAAGSPGRAATAPPPSPRPAGPLEVRVRDADGPVEGFELRFLPTAGRHAIERTDADGVAVFEEALWPAALWAADDRLEVVARVVGGERRPVQRSLWLEEHPGVVELFVRPRAEVVVEVRDARSGAPVEHARGRVRWQDAGRWTDVESTLNARGGGAYGIDAPSGPDVPDPPFEAAVLTFDAAGYATPVTLELPWDPAVPGARGTLTLEPADGALRIPAVLSAAGRPLPGERVAASLLVRRDDGAAFEQVWSGTTDENARFEVVVAPASPEDLVVLYTRSTAVPHWTAGPLPARAAAAEGVVVAVEGWPLVEAVAHGLEPGIAYAYFVWLEVEGARFDLFRRPVRPAADGGPVELTLTLPPPGDFEPNVSVRVALGPDEPALRVAHGTVLEWNGTQPEPLELVAFDLFEVTGTVAGLDGDDAWRHHAVRLRREAGEGHLNGLLDPRAGFRFTGLPRGAYELTVVPTSPPPGAGRRIPADVLRVEVQADVHGLELPAPPR